MKKYFYSVIAAASMMLAVTSCSQEEDFAPSSGEMTTFSVSLNGVTGSRATGDGTTATKLYYQAYRGDELVIDNNVDINTTTKIDMSLLKGETYDIIFWAQAPDATFYQIDDLRSITIDYGTAALNANQESYDAFYNALNDFTSDAKTHTIELRRPFAKLNLGTSDWNIVETDAATNENEPNPVTHTSVTVKGLANTLNTLTGEATGDEDVTFALSEIPTDFFTLNSVEYKRLSLNYLLVPNSKAPQGLGEYQAEGEEGKANVDLAFALNRGDKQLFTIEVPNAPVQRNWRTNVVGDLLTGSKFDVVIKPETDDDYNTLEILEEVLAKGGEVTLFSDATLPENITIPEGVTVKINLNEKTLKVNSSDNIVNGNLIISNGNLDINIPVEGSSREIAFNAVNGGKVEISDVQMTVASNNAAVTVDCNTESNHQAEVCINVNNTTMTVENGGYGIWVPFGAKYVEINVNNSSITGNNAVLLSQVQESVVVIDEKSTINKLNVDGGHATIKYAGEKPTVGGEQYVTFVPMSTTNYEGIYTVNEAKKEYNVTSAEGVLNLHKLMADLTTGEGNCVTINLTTDVDLKNEPYTPIDLMWVTFNGNGHTIKNLYVESTWKAGFFGYLGGGSINDLTIENANVTGAQAGIFAGSVEGTIDNCFLKGTNTVTWAECHQYNDPTASLEAWNGIGAITGILQPSTVNAVIEAGTTVILNKKGFTTNEGCKYIDDLTGYIGENKGTVTNLGTVTTVVNVNDDTELKAAIKSLAVSGGTITLAAGTYSQNINITVAEYGAGAKGDLVFKAAEKAEVIISGTVTLGYRNQGVGATMWDQNVTFEGITFDHANAANHSIDVQDVKSLTLKNCKIIGDGEYGINSARGNGTGSSLIANCTFENAGMQLLGNFATGLVIDDCDFNQSCVNVQAGNSVTVQNCRFTNTLKSANVGDSFYLIRSNSTPITVKGCTINIDSELSDVATNQDKWYILANRGTTNWTVENVTVTMSDAALKQTELFVTKCTTTGAINTTNLTVNGKGYASTAAQLTSAVNNNATEIYVQGEFNMPSHTTSNAITISSLNGNATIDNTLGSYWDNATLTFNNVNFKTGTGLANGNGSDYAALYSKNVTYNECNFSGPMRLGRDGAKFIDCTFNDLGNDYIWTYGNAATFQDCTFNSAGKALLIYSDGGDGAPAVSVTGCTFNATQGAKAGAIANQNCAAIEIDNTGKGVTLTTSNNTIDSNFSGEWRIKSIGGNDDVIVNDTKYTTLALDGKKMTIDGNKNVTVQQ